MAKLTLGGPEADEAIKLAMKDYQRHKKILKYANKTVKWHWFYSEADIEVARETIASIDMGYYLDKLTAAGAMNVHMAVPPSKSIWNNWTAEQREGYTERKAAARSRVAEKLLMD